MTSVSTDVLIHLDSSIDVDGITGYYIPDDGTQHVIVAALNFDSPGGILPQVLSDVHWLPGQGVKHDSLAPIPAAGGPAGYYAFGEGTQHVLAGTRIGDLIHVSWKSSQDIKNDVLLPSTFAQLVGYAGYYIPEEGTHHTIVVTSDGESPTGTTLSHVTEVYWRFGQGIQQDELARFTTAISLIGAYYIPEEGTQHVIIAASDGTLTELYWKSGQGVKQDVLIPKLLSGPGPLNDQVAAAFYSADDHTQHVVAVSADGTLTDIHWQSGQGVHQDVLTQLPSITRILEITGVTGYYSANDQKRHVIVGVSFNVATGGTLTEVYW